MAVLSPVFVNFSNWINKCYELCRKVSEQIFEIDILQVITKDEFGEKTHDIADNAEMFWIGFFFSQFEEYGWNMTEGGYSAGVTSQFTGIF